MGYVRETMIIVHGWQAVKTSTLHNTAQRLFGFKRVSRILTSEVNIDVAGSGVPNFQPDWPRYASVRYFFVAGSGSKMGWEEAIRHSANVQSFLTEAESFESYCQVIVVTSGEDFADFDANRSAHDGEDGRKWLSRSTL